MSEAEQFVLKRFRQAPYRLAESFTKGVIVFDIAEDEHVVSANTSARKRTE
jgi:hypothetical protein